MNDITQVVLEYKGLVVGIWLAVLLLGERIVPAVARRGGWTRILRNAGLWAGNIALSIVIVVPLSSWAAQAGLAWRPDWFDGWTGLAIDIVLLDFLIYWWHRVNHAAPLFWRFHEIHHLDEFLDVSSSVRFHFGEVLLSACFRALIVLTLDMPLLSILVFEAAVLIAASFQHSNLRLPAKLERSLALLIITPSIHWVHHHAIRSDTDSNYGTILSLWDTAFGSRSPTPRSPELTIGVEAQHDTGFVRLLVKPFLRRGRIAE